MQRRVLFPFSAIVDLDKLRLAVLINAINPKIGGVLIRGPKGSGKTTVVRALAHILPKITVSKICSFNCNPSDPSNMCSICSGNYNKEDALPSMEREMRVVDLPLGATEDRVVGSLDVEKAIKLGVAALEPGILAEANQNILYVDEVNLLPDHIADDLLDAAATGWNVVEREGISVSHPSRFIFIGTMNPEEGELRPQLLDRFPLSMNVERITSVEDRIEVVKRNLEFEADPEGFLEKFRPIQEELKKRIIQARELLPKVKTSENLVEVVCKACLVLKVDGLRPDIIITKAATTLAAFENRTEVTLEDVLVAAELALSHRTREGGFLEPATPDEIRKAFTDAAEETQTQEKATPAKKVEKSKGLAILRITGEASEKEEESLKKGLKWRVKSTRVFLAINRLFGGLVFGIGKKLKHSMGAPPVNGHVKGAEPTSEEYSEKEFALRKTKGIPSISSAFKRPEMKKGVSLFTKIKDSATEQLKMFFQAEKFPGKKLRLYVGKRAETVTTLHRGRSGGWKFPVGKPTDVHLPATIRAAARKQKERKKPLATALNICLEDVREKLLLYKAPMTIVFVIDLSGSMVLNIDAVKEALLKLHRDAYHYRDRVGIVALKDIGAVVVQHPITNLRVVANKLLKLRISGFTPLAAGMLKAREVLKEAKRRDASTIPVMAIITDGSANVPLKRSLESGAIRQYTEVEIAVREHENLAVKDVFSAAKIIQKDGIHTVVVNTNPHFYGRETYGFEVTKLVASITKGGHYTVGRIREPEKMVESIVEKISDEQRTIMHDAAVSLRNA